MSTVLTELQKNAIVRISFELGKAQQRGTGFVVSKDGLILTAFHVIQGSVKGQVHDGPITLRFGRPPKAKTVTLTSTALKALKQAEDYSVEGDWALLRCPILPVELEPFRLEERRLADEREWVTFGFPVENWNLGEHYGGVIRATDSRITLNDKDLKEIQVAGLSGSPCIVNASVVGLITETGPVFKAGPASKETKEPDEVLTKTSSLYAVPIARIAAACKHLTLHQSPPFQDEVCDYLRQVPSKYLDRSVAALKLTGTENLPELPKRERVAEAMLRGGVLSAFAGMDPICHRLDATEGADILDCAATMWLEKQVIQWLEQQVLQQPLRPIILNASQLETGLWSLHRAGYRSAGHPGWRTHRISILCPPGEGPMGPVLIELLTQELTPRFSRGIPPGLRRLRQSTSPLFALIQGDPPPPAAALLEVQQKFQDLILLVLMRHAAEPEFYKEYRDAGVVVVEPQIDAEQEQREHDAYLDASEDLNAKFNALKKHFPR